MYHPSLNLGHMFGRYFPEKLPERRFLFYNNLTPVKENNMQMVQTKLQISHSDVSLLKQVCFVYINILNQQQKQREEKRQEIEMAGRRTWYFKQ